MLADTPLNAVVPASDLDRAKRFNKGDRKSTRLNSSHSQISYAVFCLKKKKIHRHSNGATRPTDLLSQHLSVATLIFPVSIFAQSWRMRKRSSDDMSDPSTVDMLILID